MAIQSVNDCKLGIDVPNDEYENIPNLNLYTNTNYLDISLMGLYHLSR